MWDQNGPVCKEILARYSDGRQFPLGKWHFGPVVWKRKKNAEYSFNIFYIGMPEKKNLSRSSFNGKERNLKQKSCNGPKWKLKCFNRQNLWSSLRSSLIFLSPSIGLIYSWLYEESRTRYDEIESNSVVRSPLRGFRVPKNLNLKKKISSAGTPSSPVNFCIGVAPKVNKSTTQRSESSTNTTLTYRHHLLLPLALMAQRQRTTSEENRKTTLFKLPFGLDQSLHWWSQ